VKNDLPIIMQLASVRAILDGRKTQTRRLIVAASSDINGWAPAGDGRWEPWGWVAGQKVPVGPVVICPYGAAGTALWVKEAWQTLASLDRLSPTQIGKKSLEAGYPAPWAPCRYADGTLRDWPDLPTQYSPSGRSRSPLHMPRWLSRVSLEVVEICLEQLCDLTDASALAEGVYLDESGRWTLGMTRRQGGVDGLVSGETPREAYARSWDLLHPDRPSWQPVWVWVVTFKRTSGGAYG
jgi:hypothetical protein